MAARSTLEEDRLVRRRRLALWISAAVMTIAAMPAPAGVVEAAEPTIVVAPGDTLIGISRRHGISVEQLVSLNRIADPSRIYAGQRLLLARQAKPAPASKPTAPAAAPRSHRVTRGENLTVIARRYGVAVSAIATANRLADPSRIFVGQRLIIPGAAPAPAARSAPKPKPKAAPAAAPGRTHVVAGGENLTVIARRYGVAVSAIATANRLADPSRIYAGQRLLIPGTKPAATAPTARAVPASMSTAIAARDRVRRIILEEAKRFAVPASLALAVGWQESGWRQDVVSHAGAIGVMQLLPATGEWVGDVMLRATVDLHDARGNIRAGVRLLRHYLDRYDGALDLTLAAYYQGQTAADRHGVYAVTRPYIASIRVLIRIFGG
jgi:N-acetylmuramoyl-L-alanine amidase